MPTGDQSYELRLPEGGEIYAPEAANDPVVKALMEGYKELGYSQRDLDITLGAIKVMADRGVLQPPFDPAAEVAALGDNGAVRQQEQQTWLTSLHERKEIGDDEFGELMTLVPTAKGTRALEQLRKIMTESTTGAVLPTTTTVDPKAQAQQEAKDMAADKRYRTDRDFQRQADLKWKQAFGA